MLNGFILRFIQAELLGVVNLRCVHLTPSQSLQSTLCSDVLTCDTSVHDSHVGVDRSLYGGFWNYAISVLASRILHVAGSNIEPTVLVGVHASASSVFACASRYMLSVHSNSTRAPEGRSDHMCFHEPAHTNTDGSWVGAWERMKRSITD